MLIAIPLLLIPVVLYNVVVLFGAGGGGRVDADALLRDPVFSVTMTSGAQWTIGAGDMILFVALILLFFELVKSTSSQRAAIINHALSMVLFIAVLIEFLLLPGFATSTFFLIVTMVLLDVLAGFIVTIIASRKDFDLA
ncbi:hypothetical protein [uncultured Brevundimonas sp.]|uniref:hypothetical protein n=1 Tax=uncultured Brevundimonas sp. TaxID=213418 RepID=UPI0025985267|nr:hypothetical protein [uncultured Brevundimonas sp.]